MSKSALLWISGIFLFLTISGIWVWNRFGPSVNKTYPEKVQNAKIAKTLDSASADCNLTIRRYKQIGTEMQFELLANAGGLAPYDVEISQGSNLKRFQNLPHRFGIWFSVHDVDLQNGPATIRIKSLGQTGCQTTASFDYNASLKNEILAKERWIRQGSKDNTLDIRPIVKDGRIYLKDFANYEDNRTRVVMIDGIAVNNIDKGLEVRPGYLYSVTARWIDAPFNDWWNKLKNRSVRQQNIWISGEYAPTQKSKLKQVAIPGWFSPSKGVNVEFDTKFPEFEPIEGKLVMQYRLNSYVAPENYFKRGIGYLNATENDVPVQKMHWTATPNYFADQNETWFSGLSKEEVEAKANIPDFGVYAFDFEFWNQQYSAEARQRLIWFSEYIRKNHPKMFLMDYWGGGAYVNPHVTTMGDKKPIDLIKDYENPKSNTSNFDLLPNGQSFRNLFNVTPTDVYPRAMFPLDDQGNTSNNFILLSAIHSLRINKLIPYQKNNKFIFYGWNRYQPLYGDPIIPWNLELTKPKGELILNQLEMMPASQALSFSLFSLILFDGYYLWHDGGPNGNDINGYTVTPEATGWGKEWYPADGKTDISEIKRTPNTPGPPPFWDYPTEFYVLGNWMAKQVEDIIVGGVTRDLAFEWEGKLLEPRKEQALLAIDQKQPFVTSVTNGDKIAILAIDNFQPPNATKTIKIKLPDGTQDTIELYGNWPVLYRGLLGK